MNYISIISHIKGIDPNLIVTFVGTVITIGLTIWIAITSRQIFSPRLKFSIGQSIMSDYADHKRPLRHSIWLVDDNILGSTMCIPFSIANKSRVSARNLVIEVDFLRSAYISNEDLEKKLIQMGHKEMTTHPFFLSRHGMNMGTSVRVHYETELLHPGTELGGAEFVRWDISDDGPHRSDSVQYEDRFQGSGFGNIVKHIRATEGFVYFDVIKVSYYAENLKPKSHYLNITVLKSSKAEIRDFATAIQSDVPGHRSKKLKGLPVEKFLQDLTDRYTKCFWMGGLPRMIWMMPPLRLIRQEKLEVIPVIAAWDRTEKEKRLARKRGNVATTTMAETNVAVSSVGTPWRNYYKFPRTIDTMDKVILYHYGIS